MFPPIKYIWEIDYLPVLEPDPSPHFPQEFSFKCNMFSALTESKKVLSFRERDLYKYDNV